MNAENRISIRLSMNAYKTLEMDALSFMKSSNNISGLVNRIIKHSIDNSPASIRIRIENERQAYIDMLKKANVPSIPQKTLSAILDNRKQSLQKQMSSFAKDCSIQIRIQKDVLSLIESSESLADYASIGSYIKAIIEVYSLKGPFEREEIFYNDIISQLKTFLTSKNNGRLKVFYLTSRGNNAVFEVKPYKVMSDPDKQFHYLIGLSKPIKIDEATFNPTAFRISRINDIAYYAKSHGSGHLTKDEKKELQSTLNEKGLQYLFDDMRTFKIFLTSEGVKLFNSIAHMRPVPFKIVSNENGSKVLSFRCTDRQIRYYFFQFGSNASIIEPADIRESFLFEYQQACNAYI